MIVLYVLLALLALVLLVLLIPVQVGLQYKDALTVWVRYGLLKFRVFPINEDTPKKKPKLPKKTEKKPKKSSLSDKWTEIADNMKQDSLSETLKQVKQMVAWATKTARKVLKTITIDRLELGLLVATEEADKTAIRYGQACGVIYPALTVVGETMRLKYHDIQIVPGFGREKSVVTADVRIHVIPIRLLIVAIGALIGIWEWTNASALPEDKKG